jgi:hypothetical protein
MHCLKDLASLHSLSQPLLGVTDVNFVRLACMASGQRDIVVVFGVQRSRDAVGTLIVRNWPLVGMDHLELTTMLHIKPNCTTEASEDGWWLEHIKNAFSIY